MHYLWKDRQGLLILLSYRLHNKTNRIEKNI